MASQRLHERGYHEAERFNGTPDSQTPLDSSSVLPPGRWARARTPPPALIFAGLGRGWGSKCRTASGNPVAAA